MDNLTEGSYRTGAVSGLITGIANAGDATHGHIWAARFASSVGTDLRQVAVIQRLRVRAFTITGYTAAQEVRLAVFKLTTFTALHTGGSAVTPDKKLTGQPNPLVTARIASTGELTAGTQTIGTDPIAAAAYAELAAAATVAKGSIDIFLSTEDLTQHPIVLQNNEGLLVRSEVVQGAPGTMRLVVECDWCELKRYPSVTYNIAKGLI
jgi:hypothetical protein